MACLEWVRAQAALTTFAPAPPRPDPHSSVSLTLEQRPVHRPKTHWPVAVLDAASPPGKVFIFYLGPLTWRKKSYMIQESDLVGFEDGAAHVYGELTLTAR